MKLGDPEGDALMHISHPDYRSEQEKTLPDPARVSCFSPAARE